MFRIKVSHSAPDRMKRIDFWCNFLIGTHWRKYPDNAEIVIERATHEGYGQIECIVKPFNSSFDGYGNKVRNFPIGEDSWFGDRTNIENIVKHGFLLVPETIGVGKYYLQDDPYHKRMNSLGYDYSLQRVGFAHELQGITNGRRGEPVAIFSHGIPAGRVVSIKGVIVGNESEPNYFYEDIR